MPDVNLNVICTSFGPAEIAALASIPLAGLYVHVPFCVRKCEYCDFYSLSTGTGPAMERYVDALLGEAARWRPYLKRSGSRISTVFFGGGTPTMLPPRLMARLLEGLRERIPLADEVEWTVEANPATVNRGYSRMLLDEGVNRLSVGAQSFVGSELAMLGRAHDAEAVCRTIDDACSAGFRRFSLDLMYGVPGQTEESWRYSLAQAMRLRVEHISCYCLTLEEGTPMWEQTRSGQLLTVPEERQLQALHTTRQVLSEHGFKAYEISNYALPGQECRHNLMYWTGGSYLGLGPAAASHVAGRRWRNMPDLSRYLAGAEVQQTPIEDWEELTAQQRLTEIAMLMLRLESGMDFRYIQSLLGIDPICVFKRAIARLEEMGMLRRTVSGIALTERGIHVADEVIRELVREGS